MRVSRIAAGGAATAALVAAVVTAIVVSDPLPHGGPPQVAGAAWLLHPSSGEAIRVDGGTGRVVSRTFVGLLPPSFTVVNAGSFGLVLQPGQDAVTVLSDRLPVVGRLPTAGAGAAWPSADGGLVWLGTGGTAEPWDLTADPPARTRPPVSAGGLVARRAVVSADGALWALDATGSLRCEPAHGAAGCPGAPMDAAGATGLVLSGGRPVVVAPGRATSVDADGTHRTWPLDLPADAAPVPAGGAGLVAVSAATGALHIASPDSPARAIDLGDPPVGRAYGTPVELDGRVYVPHRGRGTVTVVDLAAPGAGPRRVPLPAGIDDASVFVHDAHVWFQQRVGDGPGDGSGVITADLRALGAATAGEPSPGGVAAGPGHLDPEAAPAPADPPETELRIDPTPCPANRRAAECPPTGPPRPVPLDGGPPRADCPEPWRGAGCLPDDRRPGGGPGAAAGEPAPGNEHQPGSDTEAPVGSGASFEWHPRPARAGWPVTFTDTSTAPGTTRRWSFAGAEPPASPAARVEVTWPAAGSYPVTLVIDGPAGRHERTEDVEVLGPDEVAVPALVGLSVDQARAALDAAGLRAGAVETARSGSAPDTVIGASHDGTPVADRRRLPAGSVVDLRASDGHGAAEIAAGAGMACARRGDGRVLCWGNGVGPVSPDDLVPVSPVPVLLPGLHRVTDVDAGGYHACAIQDGDVWCWGRNDADALGDVAVDATVEPLAVPGVRGATALALGYLHSCALVQGGEVWCWGDDGGGQLGDGTTTPSRVPRAVPGWRGFTAVAAGEGYTCGIDANRRVACVGAPRQRNLDDPGAPPRVLPRPYAVPWATGAVALAAGPVHLCVVFGDGTNRCTDPRYRPPPAGWPEPPDAASGLGAPGAAVTQLDAGYTFTCGRLEGGAVACRGGLDQLRELGEFVLPVWFPLGPAAVPVPGIDDATAVSTSGWYACALRDDSTVSCWGSNATGALGNGTFVHSAEPVTVLLPP